MSTTAQLEAGEDDCTGDSGMGTGSGNDQVDEWKRAMKKPPPVAGTYSYTYLAKC